MPRIDTLETVATAIGGRLLAGDPATPVLGISTDSRSVRPGELFFALRGERFDGHEYAADALSRGAAGVVVSHPILASGRDGPIRLVAEPSRSRGGVQVNDVLAALGRYAAWHRRQQSAWIVAVTGSNGKTTTKEMLAAVLSVGGPTARSAKSFNNFIGVPLTLSAVGPSHRFAVVEIGTNHPGEVRRLAELTAADAAVVTSVAPSHLEGLGSLDGVMAEETDGLTELAPGGLAVLNADVPGLLETARRKLSAGGRADVRVLTFGTGPSAEVRLVERCCSWNGSDCRVRTASGVELAYRLSVPGPHNTVNALAAVAVGLDRELSPAEVAAALERFQLPELRLQTRSAGAVTLIDDSYNANPGSMAAALEVLGLAPAGQRRVLCAGDMRELGLSSAEYHRALGGQAARVGVGLLILVGEQAAHTAAGAVAAGLSSDRIVSFADALTAAQAVSDWLRPNDFVLVKGSRGVRMDRLADAVAASQQHVGVGSEERSAFR